MTVNRRWSELCREPLMLLRNMMHAMLALPPHSIGGTLSAWPCMPWSPHESSRNARTEQLSVLHSQRQRKKAAAIKRSHVSLLVLRSSLCTTCNEYRKIQTGQLKVQL